MKWLATSTFLSRHMRHKAHCLHQSILHGDEMDKRLRKRNVLRDIPYVRDPVNIETSEIDQPSSLVERVKRLSNPGWFVSFALHLILLIALGLWILPSVIDRPIGLMVEAVNAEQLEGCLLYTSPSPRDGLLSRMPSSA